MALERDNIGRLDTSNTGSLAVRFGFGRERSEHAQVNRTG